MLLNKDAKAVVTGGASGMGEAVVSALREKDINVVILDSNVELLKEKASQYGAHGLACDVSDSQSVEDAFKDINELPGTLRVAVNCAGIAPARRAVGRDGPMPLEDFSKVINVNLLGSFNVLRMAASLMFNTEAEGEERGVIINTASVAAYEGQIGQSAYSASKGGIVGMTLPLAREFASQGIRVNTIAPGLVATPLLLNMPKDVQDSLGAMVPFPKRLAKVSEFAALALHIIENTYINGETIRMDGAIRMQPK